MFLHVHRYTDTWTNASSSTVYSAKYPGPKSVQSVHESWSDGHTFSRHRRKMEMKDVLEPPHGFGYMRHVMRGDEGAAARTSHPEEKKAADKSSNTSNTQHRHPNKLTSKHINQGCEIQDINVCKHKPLMGTTASVPTAVNDNNNLNEVNKPPASVHSNCALHDTTTLEIPRQIT